MSLAAATVMNPTLERPGPTRNSLSTAPLIDRLVVIGPTSCSDNTREIRQARYVLRVMRYGTSRSSRERFNGSLGASAAHTPVIAHLRHPTSATAPLSCQLMVCGTFTAA